MCIDEEMESPGLQATGRSAGAFHLLLKLVPLPGAPLRSSIDSHISAPRSPLSGALA